jgi:hypothetical protein
LKKTQMINILIGYLAVYNSLFLKPEFSCFLKQ